MNEAFLRVSKLIVNTIKVRMQQTLKISTKDSSWNTACSTFISMEKADGLVAECPYVPAITVHFPVGFIGIQDCLDGQRSLNSFVKGSIDLQTRSMIPIAPFGLSGIWHVSLLNLASLR